MGVAAGLLLAAALYVLGMQFGLLFVISMVLFLVLSALATRAGAKRKMALKLFEKSRGIRNVAANGMGPLVMAIIFYSAYARGMGFLAMLSVIGFMGSVAAIASDKFASEIGVLGAEPRMLLTLRKVRKGVSGGVSLLGLGASFAAALIIALLVLPYLPAMGALSDGIAPAAAFASVLLGGFFGNIIDSALGYYEDKGIGNKFSTNFVCSISGAVLAMLLYMAL
ncbi:MAG: DUF92 domain-containing protein [Candidatus Micrarchaeaceae archaeon]